MSDLKPRAHNKLLVELQRLCQEKLSGTLFILDDNRRTAKISLKDGDILSLSCFNKNGAEALRLIQGFDGSLFQFIRSSAITTDPDLPTTTEILRILAGGLSTAPTTPAAPEGRGLAVSNPEIVAVLKEILAEFMGPVAPMICNKVLRQAANLESAVDLLAREIPDSQQAFKFKEQVREKLSLN